VPAIIINVFKLLNKIMFKNRNVIITVLAVALVLLTMASVSAGVFDFLDPSNANPDDEVFEAIGGDDFLNATLRGCVKTGEENIPDATFNTSDGEYAYYGAKNISYVNEYGNHGYIIVWKTSPDKYNFDTSANVNIYSSNYLLDEDAKSFIEYSYENNAVYGIIIGTDEIQYSESDLVYDVLGLNPNGFSLSYTNTGTSASVGTSSSGADHYHTVLEDRYSMSRNDPDSYYDHYEYGDNYEIDDYLESEGYD
jgi:hypothetical protein